MASPSLTTRARRSWWSFWRKLWLGGSFVRKAVRQRKAPSFWHTSPTDSRHLPGLPWVEPPFTEERETLGGQLFHACSGVSGEENVQRERSESSGIFWGVWSRPLCFSAARVLRVQEASLPLLGTWEHGRHKRYEVQHTEDGHLSPG